MNLEDLQENKLQILGKVTASLIHEIRNPLSAITLNLQYLQMIESELPDDVKESLLACEAATNHIRSLIENLSSFTRKNKDQKIICSIEDVTLESIRIMKTTAFDKHITIKKNLDPNFPQIYTDRNKLMQIFLNLIMNSIEACDIGGEILISTYTDTLTSQMIWEIQDNGLGISEEEKPLILNDFYTSKIKGTGLGLSICQSILKDFECELKFESEQGVGTRFFILLNPELKRENYEVQNTSC